MPESKLPQDVQEALADVRRIRELVGRTRDAHPMRTLMRPLLRYMIASGPFVAAFGYAAERILDAQLPIAGLSPEAAVTLLGLATLIALGGLKTWVLGRASRAAGYSLVFVMSRFYSTALLRMALPTLVLLVAAGVLVGQHDPSALALLITLGFGGYVIGLPLVVPMPEFTAGGILLMIGALVAFFVLPGRPFDQLALSWGAGLPLFGAVGLWQMRGKRE